MHIQVRMKMKEAEAGIIYSIQEEAAGWRNQGSTHEDERDAE